MKESTRTNILVIAMSTIVILLMAMNGNIFKPEKETETIEVIKYVPEYHNQTIYSNTTTVPEYYNYTYWGNSTLWNNATFWNNSTVYSNNTIWNNETVMRNFWINHTVEYVYYYNNSYWFNSTVNNTVDNTYWNNKTIVVICGPPPGPKPPCGISMEQAVIRSPIIPRIPTLPSFPIGKNDWRFPPDPWPLW
jgi:hypothetical protein